MTGKDLFDKIKPTFLRIGPSEKTIYLFNEISASLEAFYLIDTFYQLKKNETGDGLALEIMFFDTDFIHDIVITQNTTEHIIVRTQKVLKFSIITNFGESKDEKGEITSDLLQFKISYNALDGLVYKTDIKRFTEINRIKANLLKTLKK